MGMSTHVMGFHPPDERFMCMKSIWDKCTEAGVSIPEEVSKFFGHKTPDDVGIQVDIPYRKYSGDMVSGIEIDIQKIPPQVTVIRFVNSY